MHRLCLHIYIYSIGKRKERRSIILRIDILLRLPVMHGSIIFCYDDACLSTD